jgi:hypothetical protein
MLWLAAQMFLDNRLERDRLIVMLIPGAVQECDRAAPDSFQQGRKALGISLKLLAVARLEFLPASWIVAEPSPQRITGCDVAQPEINPRSLLAHPAGPDSINEHTQAIIRSRLIVDPAQPDADRRLNATVVIAHGMLLAA